MKVNGQQALLLQPDAASPNLIGGYSGNSVTSGKHGATIGGGGQSGTGNNNRVTADFGTVTGGYGNTAGTYSIASGYGNNASGVASTAFGDSNTAAGYASIALGGSNHASGGTSTALGSLNTASGDGSTALGFQSHASGNESTASGLQNTASGGASTALGFHNTAGGDNSTAFGTSNTAGGANSFAGGNNGVVQAGHDSTFLWSDGNFGSTSPTVFKSTAAQQFDVRATGGVTFQTNAGGTYTTGCQLFAGGGAWSCASDRHVKRGFAPISLKQVLRKIAGLWISTWSYRTDPSHTRHIGPVAQDFKSAFQVGSDPRSIGLLDEGGVALAGVKGLYQLVQQQQTLMQRQQALMRSQQAEITSLRAHLTRLEAKLTK